MPRYVILLHTTPLAERGARHWDLMLEDGRVLCTWSLPEEPWAGRAMTAERLPDHRLKYLDYEGPISRGRGRVGRWDRGTFRTVTRTPRRWQIVLAGQRLLGDATLVRIESGSQRWSIELPAD